MRLSPDYSRTVGGARKKCFGMVRYANGCQNVEKRIQALDSMRDPPVFQGVRSTHPLQVYELSSLRFTTQRKRKTPPLPGGSGSLSRQRTIERLAFVGLRREFRTCRLHWAGPRARIPAASSGCERSARCRWADCPRCGSGSWTKYSSPGSATSVDATLITRKHRVAAASQCHRWIAAYSPPA